MPAGSILFLTDSVKEYDASEVAGFKARLLVRPGNPEIAADDLERLQVVSNLDEVEP